MAKKKAKKKTAKSAPAAKKVAAPEPVVESAPAPAPALVPEQMVTRRGTPVGGAKTMTRSEYDKQMKG